MLPGSMRDAVGDAYVELVAPVAAQRGEPWLTFLTPGEMSDLLEKHGFESIEHAGQRDALGAARWDRTDSLRPIDPSRLTHATVGASG